MFTCLNQKEWDIVIADYSMPHFSGIAALKLLKEQKPDLPFIIVSGVIGEETAVEAMRAGAHDYLMKGNLTRLIPAIEREIREAKVRADRRKAEEAFTESQRTLMTLMSNLPGMAYRSKNDPKWTMEFVSDGSIDLTGYQPADLIDNNSIPYIEIIHPDDRETVWNQVQAALKVSSPYQLLYRINTKQGNTKWVWEKGRGVHSGEGVLLALEGFVTDITERKEAEEKIRESLKEKEILLKEIHHRVKNNLQIIYSLLNLQSGYVKDPLSLDMFRECRNRVKSMAIIHEVLYQSKDLAKVNFADYIKSLVSNLVRSYGAGSSGIDIKIDVGEVRLDIDTAIPCGLIINELVSNALKYAFPNGRRGQIIIDFHDTDTHRYVLMVKDDGVGLPEGLNFHNTETLGLQLVSTLTDQLRGNLELNRNDGTEFKITFSG
jgi:two-component system response regulator